MEVVLSELALFVDNKVYSITARREEVMLKRSWSEVGVDDMARLFVCFGDPVREFHSVRNGGGEEDIVNCVRQENNSLLPDDPTF